MIPDEEKLYESLCLRHGKERQEKFSRANVIIFGLGGLGSHIAVILARAGVGYLGHIHLVDCDKVELTNIHRQNYDLADIGVYKPDALKQHLLTVNPYLDVQTTRKRVTEKDIATLIAGKDVVIEAFDGAETKSMLTDAFFTHKKGNQCLFAASGMAGFGNGNSIQTRKINESFYITGDEKSDLKREKTLYASRVSICAAAQAHAVLQYISDKH